MNITEHAYDDALGHLTLNGQIKALILGRDYAYKQFDQLNVTLDAHIRMYHLAQDYNEQATLHWLITEIESARSLYNNAITQIGLLITERVALRRIINNRKKLLFDP